MIESIRYEIVSQTPSIFERIGGFTVIEKSIERFIDKCVSDKNLKEFFKPVDGKKLRDSIKNFFIFAFGGPNK